MRWGIADVERWLASIEPRVIDAWLAYAAIEPEAFEAEAGQHVGRREPGPGDGPLLDPAEAAARMARRLG